MKKVGYNNEQFLYLTTLVLNVLIIEYKYKEKYDN